MENIIEVFLDKFFLTLSGLEEIKNHSSFAPKNVSFGFDPKFRERGPFFFDFFSSFLECKNIVGSTMEEKLKIKDAIAYLKCNFMPNYKRLPIYFEANDYENKWIIRNCGKYYFCDRVDEILNWGSFRFTNSEDFAKFWIEQKRSKYSENILVCEKKLNKTKIIVRNLEDIEIPRYKNALKKFNLAKIQHPK